MEFLDSPYFCEYMWTHLYKSPDDNVKLCCIDKGDSLGNLQEKTLEEIRNGDVYKKIRKDVLAGKKLDRCKICHEQEEKGIGSYRKTTASFKNYDEYAKPILFLDYRADNTCNLACKSCGSGFSTKLIDTDLKLGIITESEASTKRLFSKKNKKVLEYKDALNNIENIYFAGGEPLVNQQHWGMLDYLKNTDRLKNITLSYNTNLTTLTFKNYKVEDYWYDVESIDVMASIDGFDKGFEYFRTGAKWNTIVDNMKRVTRINKNALRLSITVGWMNLKSVLDLCKFVLENNIISSYENIDLTYMYGCEGGKLSETPLEIKNELIENINLFLDYLSNHKKIYEENNLKSILISFIKTINNSVDNDNSFKKWITKLKIIDKQYKTNINEILTFKNPNINNRIQNTYNSIVI